MHASNSRRHRFLLLLIAAIAVTGVACAAIATYVARDQYRRWAAVRVHPTYENRFAAENRELAPAARPRIILFGDSRMVRWNPEPAPPDVEMIQRAVEGETTAQMRYRFKADALDLHPSVVVIQAGINDLVAGTAAGRGREALENAVLNLTDFINAAEAAGSGVIVMTVVRPARPPLWRRLVWSDSIIGLVEELNGRLMGLARPSVRILDADTMLSGSAHYLPDRYSTDTLHFNAAAYQVLSTALIQMLKEHSDAVQQ